MAKKTYRRFVRVGNDLISSPRFTRKSDADDWYEQMKRKKQFVSSGLIVPKRKNEGLKFIDYAREWLLKRKKEYNASTWTCDEQRLRDYILPYFSDIPITHISSRDIREILTKITSEENLSTATRTRVQALLSKLFSDAFNDEIVPTNPVFGIKFEEKRKGKKKPVYIESTKECLKFLDKAKELGPLYLTAVGLTIMTGLRKSEIIALTWDDIDFSKNIISVNKRVEQVTLTIKEGTKAGEFETRAVPFSDELKSILKNWQKNSKSNYLFTNSSGDRFMSPRMFYDLIVKVSDESGVKTHVHGLRHTFGREFAANTGNLKVLQSILGHSSSSTTDIYSELSGERIKGFGEVVTFGVKKSNG